MIRPDEDKTLIIFDIAPTGSQVGNSFVSVGSGSDSGRLLRVGDLFMCKPASGKGTCKIAEIWGGSCQNRCFGFCF